MFVASSALVLVLPLSRPDDGVVCTIDIFHQRRFRRSVYPASSQYDPWCYYEVPMQGNSRHNESTKNTPENSRSG
ncbi:hypothetical protein EDB81DRAFT_795461 [Dactylonectria macrodidyma]|uniref:Secreted protein n=1 Tax=Dactylonectria macrodidyma TaxID=307937 RepID=A0A9P9EWQ1_9HYPO|nr:hypothetical protein EDB81DRAFT_795461 [Dactylonectria macrodidyma]